MRSVVVFFFFQAEDGIRDRTVTGVQTCALPICSRAGAAGRAGGAGSRSPRPPRRARAARGSAAARRGRTARRRPRKIGRASCRGRVWVEGVGGGVKNKERERRGGIGIRMI